MPSMNAMPILPPKSPEKTSNKYLNIRPLANIEIPNTLPLLKEFYKNLDEETISLRLREVSKLNWKCIGAFLGEELVGLTGYWINTRLYCGKYLYIDHFIISPELRKQGFGEALLEKAMTVAKSEDCAHVCLDTFVSNSSAQRFWYKNGFSIVGYHFVAPIND